MGTNQRTLNGTRKAARQSNSAPKRVSRCRWCEAGDEPRPNGEHWMVKSVFPAVLNIRTCKRAKALLAKASGES